MGRVRTMSQQDIDWMLANYEVNSQEDCATQLNVSVRTIARWAESLGLNKQHKASTRIAENPLRRKDCVVKKCCLICGHYKDCDTASRIDGSDAAKMLCWDFELNKELKIERL